MRKMIAVAAAAALASCAIGMVSAASASATWIENKEGAELVQKGFKSFIGLTIKSGSVEVVCNKGKGNGEITSLSAGRETVTAEECKLGAISCESAGDGAGNVLLSWTIGYGLGPGETRLLGMELTAVTSFKCGATEVQVQGGWLALLQSKVGEPRLALLWKAEPLATTYSIMGGAERTLKLEVKLSGESTFKAASMTGNDEQVFEEEVKMT